MEDKLEEFNKLVAVQNYRYAMDGFYEPDGSTDSSVDEIWKFIKDNYISKEEVEKERNNCESVEGEAVCDRLLKLLSKEDKE